MKSWLKIVTAFAVAIVLFCLAVPPAQAQGEGVGTLPALGTGPGFMFAVGQSVSALQAGCAAAVAAGQSLAL